MIKLKVLNGIGTRMNQIVNLNVLLGIIGIPINIMIAVSLANAVSAAASADWDQGIYNTGVFALFTAAGLFITIFKKTVVARLTSKAKQNYRQ